jgi:hypothetical protein
MCAGLLEKIFRENPEATPDGNYVVQLFKQVAWLRVALVLDTTTKNLKF